MEILCNREEISQNSRLVILFQEEGVVIFDTKTKKDYELIGSDIEYVLDWCFPKIKGTGYFTYEKIDEDFSWVFDKGND